MLTKDKSKRFCYYMLGSYGLKLKPKTGSVLMEIVRVILQFSKEVWVRFTTKVGNTIYSDIVPGTGETFYELVREIGLFTHECCHACLSWWKYAFNKDYRATEEVEGYAASMWVYYYFTGYCIPISEIIKRLELYKLDKPQLEVAEHALLKVEMVIKNGGLPNKICAVAMQWFDKNGLKSDWVERSKGNVELSRHRLMIALLK